MSSRLNPEKTFAILMGCSRFDEGFDPIPPVERNLRDLQQLLADQAILGLKPERISLIENMTSSSATKLLKRYADEAKAAKATTLLFYYAGHGYCRTDGKYFLTATDSDTELINLDGVTGISFDDAIAKVLEQSKIPQKIIIVDACYSGSIAQGDAVALPNLDIKGSYTLTSSSKREASFFDVALCEHTFFTSELIDTLRTGVDNGKDVLTLADLYTQLQKQMRAKKYPMSPQKKGTETLEPHTFAFCKNKAFDGERIEVQRIEKWMQNAIKNIEAGDVDEADAILVKALRHTEKLTRETHKDPLLQAVQRHLAFCEHYADYRPIFEKILGSDQRAALATAQATIAQLEADQTTLKATIATLQHDLTHKTAQADKATKDLIKAQATTAQLEANQTTLKATIATLQRDLTDKTAQAHKATKDLTKAQATIAQLETQLADTQTQLRELKAKHEAPQPAPPQPNDKMVFIKGGTYDMGDVMGDKEYSNETVHRVTLSDFYIGRHAVTLAEYDAFCEATKREKPSDSGWGRENRPVINVSWYDVVEYCNWLSEQQGLTKVYTIKGEAITPNWTANGYRLPTEAEWEYAAREGGKKVRFGNGKDVIDPKDINFDARKSYKKPYSVVGEYRQQTVPVGSLNSPNALGLQDMSGNVWEWCWDWHGHYPTAAQTNPKGADQGASRVGRGGGWGYDPWRCRAAIRYNWAPTFRSTALGFRLARS